MALYSIKDLERLSGIKAHTIRIWEQRYGVLKPQRTETNIRRYDDIELKLLLNLSQLIKHGNKISRLSSLSSEELCRELEIVTDKVTDADDLYTIYVDKLIISMVDFCERKFEKVIAVTTIKFGFEATMRHVILPFLRKVGILWQTGEINVAQEHFASNLIRRKMIVAIDGLLIPEQDKRYVLFLPEGEYHELGLLFAKYYFKMRGIQTLYLGQAVPLKDLTEAIDVYKPEGTFTFLTSPSIATTTDKYLLSIKKQFPNLNLLLAGSQLAMETIKPINGVSYFGHVDDFLTFIDSH